MNVAVLDVGKSNVKAVVVDSAGRGLAARTRPNRVLTSGPYPRSDVNGIVAFFLEALTELHAAFGFEAISTTPYGASGVLLGSIYAVLMTQACLDLTGASGLIIVEGPFARNPLYVGALGKVTWRPVIGVAGATGTSAGAALPPPAP